jgi:hypothetical protein
MNGMELKERCKGLSMDMDMGYTVSTKSLVIQFDPKCDDTYLKDNYVPHGMTRKTVKSLTL